MTSRLVWIALVVSVLSVILFWATDIPLGVTGSTANAPNEWTWLRYDWQEAGFLTVLPALFMVSIAGIAHILLARWGAESVIRFSRSGRCLLILALVVSGFVWLSLVQRCVPYSWSALKPNLVLYDPGASGYFNLSLRSDDTSTEFLAGYEAIVSGGEDVLHLGTHPPGLFLMHRGLISLCESSEKLTDCVLATQPKRFDKAFRLVEAQLAPPMRDHERAALWLAVLLSQLAAAATVIPLYWLIALTATVASNRIKEPRRIAWMAACFWPLIPALGIFLPKSDALYPFFFTLTLPLWFYALFRRSYCAAAVTGILVWLCALASLAVLPVCFVLVLSTCMLAITARRDASECTFDLAFSIRAVMLAASALGLCVAGFWLLTDVNCVSIWFYNLKNHSAFYDRFTRTYWKWLLVNPLELLLAIGAPLSVVGIAGLVSCGKRAIEKSNSKRFANYLRSVSILSLTTAATLLLLWLSGKNNGEAARLWIFLMPWIVWIAASAINSETRTPAQTRVWVYLLAMQALVSVATVSRVSGFHYEI